MVPTYSDIGTSVDPPEVCLKHHVPAIRQAHRGRDGVPRAEQLFAGYAAGGAAENPMEDVDDIARQVTRPQFKTPAQVADMTYRALQLYTSM